MQTGRWTMGNWGREVVRASEWLSVLRRESEGRRKKKKKKVEGREGSRRAAEP